MSETMPVEIDVEVLYQAAGDPPPAPLAIEDHAFAVLKIVEERAGEIAIGPVIACDYDDRKIDLIFTVEAENMSDAYRRVGEVLDVIAENAPFELTAPETKTKVPEPVPA